jgi:uncharacterized protein
MDKNGEWWPEKMIMVLILLAKAEKKIWISPGYGLEDRLTAGIGGNTRNIIEFKAGSYYKGLDKGLTPFDVLKANIRRTKRGKFPFGR